MPAHVTQVWAEVLRTTATTGNFASASTTITFTDAGSAGSNVARVAASTTVTFTGTPKNAGDFEAGAAHTITITTHNTLANLYLAVNAATSLTFSPLAGVGHTYLVLASTTITMTPGSTGSLIQGPTNVFVDASTILTFVDAADQGSTRTYVVNASTQITMTGVGSFIAHLLKSVSAATAIAFTDAGNYTRLALASAATTVTMTGDAGANRDVHVSASTSLGLGSAEDVNEHLYKNASLTITFSGSGTSIITGHEATARFEFMDRADAIILLPPGGGNPGGSGSGVRTVLLPSCSGEFPNSYAETPSGLILIANGIDPMFKWDGLAGRADTAGIIAPASAIAFGGTGAGTIIGKRVAYVRFLDADGNVSNLSPVSNEVDFGTDGLIDAISYSASGVVTVTSKDHGRSTNDPIIIEQVQGLGLVNGTWTITVLDEDRFTINGLVITSGTYTFGGRWIFGIATVLYGSVPISAEPKVIRRQILRNLDGNSETFYVDIDTDDTVSTAFTSTADDETLAGGTPVPLFSADDTNFANRYWPPPSHKALVAAHLGRIFAAGDVSYTDGNCRPVFGQNLIYGTGTQWRASFVGRVIYMGGASSTYEIASVDEVNQVITTTATITDSLGPFTSYAIRPPIGERRFAYYTEPALPEAWPPWNAISLPEDSDDITGLMVMRSFIFIIEKRHIYKFTFQSDPARDGFVFPTTRRGCINNRCWVIIEDDAYMLDEQGIHRYDGQESKPISQPIQSLFQKLGNPGDLQVNWHADQRYWHAAHDPVRDTIRWFVAMSGCVYPRHSICYDYRRDRWWLEEYPFQVSSSTIATIGYRRSVAGVEARRVLCLGEGSLDTVDAGNAIRGTVTDWGPLSLTDSNANFPSGLAGAPVSIATGRGAVQERKIVDNTPTILEVDRPWTIGLDDTSVYQIGGVNWSWQSGWFRFVEEEQSNPRDIEVVFPPLANPASFNVRLFHDHSQTPESWARTIVQDGITTTEGQPEITIDSTYAAGFVAQRITRHRDTRAPGGRYVSVELSGVQAADIQRVYQVNINGVRESQ
jgi:hypothetical protein